MLKRLFQGVRRAPVTTLVGGACVVVFALMAFRGHLAPHALDLDFDTRIRFGALDPQRVWTGQPWRLLTAGFVHVNLLHLAFDVVTLAVLGPRLERVLVPWRMVLLLLGAQLGCTSAALLFGDYAVRGGASGMGTGLIGALVLALLRNEETPALGGRRQFLLLAVLALGFVLLPEVDLLGHLGGLAGGAAMMAGLEPSRQHRADHLISLFFASVLLAIAVRLALVQPARADWNVSQAVARYQHGDFAGAIPFLERAATQPPGFYSRATIEERLGTCLLHVGKPREALARLKDATEAGDADAARILGDNEENPHRELLAYAHALELEPGDRATRDKVLHAALDLLAEGRLPTPEDLAPLAHLPETPELTPVNLLRETILARAGELNPLADRATNDTTALRVLQVAEAEPKLAAAVLYQAILAQAPELYVVDDGGTH